MLPGKIVTPTAGLVLDLAENMQEADVRECWAASHVTPFDALSFSVTGSRDPKCWVVNGRAVTMYGVAENTALTNYSVPWLLASNLIEELSRPFIRGCRLVSDEWKREHNTLRNFVDSRHTKAVRWIKWMGFEVFPARPFGPDQVPFHKFEWIKKPDHEHDPSHTGA